MFFLDGNLSTNHLNLAPATVRDRTNISPVIIDNYKPTSSTGIPSNGSSYCGTWDTYKPKYNVKQGGTIRI